MRMRNKKLPHLQHADEQWRFFLTSVEVSVELLLIPGAYRAAKRRGSMQFRILPIHTAKFKHGGRYTKIVVSLCDVADAKRN